MLSVYPIYKSSKKTAGIATAIAASFFSSFSIAYGACSVSDMQKEWYVEYTLKKPLQQGACLFNLIPSVDFIGLCHNQTYELYNSVTNVRSSIKKNCKTKVVATLDNGQVLTAEGKLKRVSAYGSGKVKVVGGGYKYSGNYKMWDTAAYGLSSASFQKAAPANLSLEMSDEKKTVNIEHLGNVFEKSQVTR